MHILNHYAIYSRSQRNITKSSRGCLIAKRCLKTSSTEHLRTDEKRRTLVEPRDTSVSTDRAQSHREGLRIWSRALKKLALVEIPLIISLQVRGEEAPFKKSGN